MEPKREPKWSSRGSQDGAKKERKNEVKLSRLKGGKRGVQQDLGEFVTRPLGEKGRPKTTPRPPQDCPRPPKGQDKTIPAKVLICHQKY